MGCSLSVGRVKFGLAPEDEAAALAALKKEHRREELDLNHDLSGASSFEEAMNMLGWKVLRKDGSIRGLDWVADRSTVDEQIRIFKAIRRSVEPGSIIELDDEYRSDAVRIRFKEGSFKVRRIGELSGDRFEGDDSESVDDRPTFAQIKSQMPTRRAPYSPSMTALLGGWIEHSRLGPGLVVGTSDADKIEVLFEGESKVLKVGAISRRKI